MPTELMVNAGIAALFGAGGFFVSLVNRAPKMAEATDARLKILIQGYEKRTESLVQQIEGYERRIEGLTRQYEQRIESLMQRIDEYEHRIGMLMDTLDNREAAEGETHA